MFLTTLTFRDPNGTSYARTKFDHSLFVLILLKQLSLIVKVQAGLAFARLLAALSKAKAFPVCRVFRPFFKKDKTERKQ